MRWRNAPGTECDHDLAQRSLRPTAVDAPAHRRRLQRLVDVPDPARPSPRTSGCRCRCSSSGTTPSTGCAPRRGLPDGDGARHGDLAHVVPEKDDTSDWQAYFHLRNRLVGAALHGPDDPKAMLTDILKRTVRHLMLMEYSAVALQHKALRDFLAGPEALFPNLATVLAQVRAARAEYDDGRPLDSATDVPPSTLDGRLPGLPRAADLESRRSSRPWPAASCATCARRTRRTGTCRSATCRRGRRSGSCSVPGRLRHGLDPGRPRRHLPPPRPAAVPRPSCKTAAQLLGTTAREWPTLRRRYREAAPHLTSREGWKQIFEG